MSKNQLRVYDAMGKNIRVILEETGPMFVLGDLCDAIGIKNPAQVATKVPTEEKGICSIYSSSGSKNALCVTEPGMYRVLLRSKTQTPWVRKFQHSVFHEILPQIQKTGKYDASLQQVVLRQINSEADRFDAFMNNLDSFLELLQDQQKSIGMKNDAATAQLLHQAQMKEKIDLNNAMIAKLPGHISKIVAAVVDKKLVEAKQPDNSEALDRIRAMKQELLQLETDLTSGN